MNRLKDAPEREVSGGPRLSLVATPIGNLGDITFRAVEALKGAQVLVCEDTRRTQKLLTHLDIPRPPTFFACNDFNERKVVGRILELMERGVSVVVCSDAGMPLISDPGFVLAREARARGYPVEIVPGPSAVSTALLASGLPVHAFTFRGFPPKKGGPRRRFLSVDRRSPHTLIFFESPERLPSFLVACIEVFGPDREAAVCLELTKCHERVHRGTLLSLAELFTSTKARGELSIVIAGRPGRRAGKGSPEE